MQYETAFSAYSQCSVMFLNPAQFDANSTANPSVEMPPIVTQLPKRRRSSLCGTIGSDSQGIQWGDQSDFHAPPGGHDRCRS
jgi:hypothetical protein